METFDAILVGGGPAGSTCAWKLRQAGLHALVIDRKPFPRDKTCAGWITPPVVQALELDVPAYQAAHVCQPITGFRCGLIGGGEVDVHYGRVVSYGIRRFEFDNFLLRRAGGPQQLDEGVECIERGPKGWQVNGRYAAPLLIGAGGNFCPVARHLNARQQSLASQVVAQEIEFEADARTLENVSGEMPGLYFCPDLRGYGWCFRKGNFLNVGFGRTASDDFPARVAEFREHLAARGQMPDGAQRPWKGHAYQLYDRAPTLLCDEGVLLIGDSAGLAYAQSGEGIRPAVESALLAADVIVRARGRRDRAALAPYEARLKQRLGSPGRGSRLGEFATSWLVALAARLVASRWFARHVILDRLFLHRHESKLVV